ncbi:MAG: hypothetical protein NVSMB32_11080 [Actinomycetota bacterium]
MTTKSVELPNEVLHVEGIAAARERSFGYERSLDGVRAAAILAVLAAHSIPHGSGGLIGVDIFFVLSGFLITRILLAERAKGGRIDFRNFYIRRALRLAPALVLLLVMVAVLPDVFHPSVDGVMVTRGWSMLTVAGYVSNWVLPITGHGLFGYLDHTWSLAIEEQFYLLWPLTLIVLLRIKQGMRWILPGFIVGIVVVRLGLSLHMRSALGDPNPFHLHSALADSGVVQADALLIGAVLAWISASRDRLLAWTARPAVGWGACLGLGAIALALGIPARTNIYPLHWGGFTVVAVLTAALIAHFLSGAKGTLTRLFSWPPAVALGRVSYGVYLFHRPIFAWVQHQAWGRPTQLMIEYIATAMVVTLSWYLVEQPFLLLKRRFRPRVDF